MDTTATTPATVAPPTDEFALLATSLGYPFSVYHSLATSLKSELKKSPADKAVIKATHQKIQDLLPHIHKCRDTAILARAEATAKRDEVVRTESLVIRMLHQVRDTLPLSLDTEMTRQCLDGHSDELEKMVDEGWKGYEDACRKVTDIDVCLDLHMNGGHIDTQTDTSSWGTNMMAVGCVVGCVAAQACTSYLVYQLFSQAVGDISFR